MLVTGTSPWPGWHALWLIPIGSAGLTGQLCMTRAYASAGAHAGGGQFAVFGHRVRVHGYSVGCLAT
jgi:hypothetical protein